MIKVFTPILFASALLNPALVGATQNFEFYPGVTYEQQVPTLEQVVGHGWGEEVSSYAQIERYAAELAARSPLVELRSYGQSWEGRKLYLLIISSPENLQRIGEIQNLTRQLAYPQADSGAVPRDLPATVWLAYGIHGNEISSPEAALLTAYHLAAAGNDPLVQKILEDCVVLIDPTENPDGRDRFVSYLRQTRGRWPDADPSAAEHNEFWPGGRSNHYLFDMNRDWFALTQPETRGRVQVFLDWFPQVVVDVHEMGGNSTYYFAPPAEPLNPELTESQQAWLERFGRNNARWFDDRRIDYFTRQIFDSFYPGYGEGWPMFHGSIGMTYEQASVRGLVLRRDDETLLHFRESVRHHFIASLSTLETAAASHEQLLEDFAEFRRSAARQGPQGEVREYILPPAEDTSRLYQLIDLLMRQGIQVRQSVKGFTHDRLRGYFDDALVERDFEKGTFIVPVAQPAGRLASTLLGRQTPMSEEFLAEQIRRRSKRQSDQFYDITAWSLPLLYDLECFSAEQESQVESTLLGVSPGSEKEQAIAEANLAYLVPWGTLSSARLLGALLGEGIRVYASARPFSLQGRDFPSGSLIVKTRDNPQDLLQKLQDLASKTGTEVLPTNSGWVDTGVNLGSNDVFFVRKPRVAVAYGPPTRSSSVGAFRYLMDQVYEFPVTAVHTADVASADLARYNVIVLPEASSSMGGYSGLLGESGLGRLKNWIREGGTLVALGEASRWLTEEKVGLLATSTEKKEGEAKPEAETEADEESSQPTAAYDELIRPDEESPDAPPGAIVRVALDPEHWLAYGYGSEVPALVASQRIFTPLKLDKGVNVGYYFPPDTLQVSGFMWNETREQMGNKAFLMCQTLGRGNVVAFAEDPTFRAFLIGLHRLLLNALFFGPAH